MSNDKPTSPSAPELRARFEQALREVVGPDVDVTTADGVIAGLALIGRGRFDAASVRALERAMAELEELPDVVDELTERARFVTQHAEADAVLETIEELALAARALGILGAEKDAPGAVKRAREAIESALARASDVPDAWRYGARAERSRRELGDLEPWRSIARAELPGEAELADDVVLAWIGGALSVAHSREISLRVQVEGPYRDAYRRQLAALVSRGVAVREGGPRAPELARAHTVVRLPHLGPEEALRVIEERAGTSWCWPGTAPRLVAAGVGSVDIGDDVTGPLRAPIEYVPPSAREDAEDLDAAAARCVEHARGGGAAAAEAARLAAVLGTFADELRRIARAAADGTVSDEDARIADVLVSARLRLEHALAEITDNEALAEALLELDARLDGCADAALLADPDEYARLLQEVAVVPGRWWSVRAELDETVVPGVFDALRDAGASAPADTPRDAWRVSVPRRSEMALAAATYERGPILELSIPAGGILRTYRDGRGAVRAQIFEASAPGPYRIRWTGPRGAGEAIVERAGKAWESAPLPESVLAADEIVVTPEAASSD